MAVEARTRPTIRRHRTEDHRLPLPTRHKQMEQDRTPALLSHYRQLAWPAAGELPNRRQPYRQNHNLDRPRRRMRARPEHLPDKDQAHQAAEERDTHQTTRVPRGMELYHPTAMRTGCFIPAPKVVTVSPDYADNTKFADEWLPAQAGTDAALAMAMGHVILREYLVDREVPFFGDFVRRYTDLPFLVTLMSHGGGAAVVPGKFLTAADLPAPAGGPTEGAEWKTVLFDESTGAPVVPNGSIGFRYTDSGIGRWNLDLDGVTPRLSCEGSGEAVEVLLPCFEAPDGSGSVLRRGVPVRRVGAHLVTTVFDLMLAQYGVG